MHFYWLPFAVLLTLVLAMDVTIYRKLKHSCRWPHRSHHVFAWLNLIPVAMAIAAAAKAGSTCSNSAMLVKTWLLWGYLLVTIPKILFFAIYSISWISAMGSRWQAAVRVMAAVIAAAAAAHMLWSTVVTPRNIQICHVQVNSARVPQSFDGYRIVQISDMHVGTYGSDTGIVASIVAAANAQHPNLICFTGDMVNRTSSEAIPFMPTLRKLSAPHGIIAIEGNHDNPSRYYHWPTPRQAAADSLRLIGMERQLGWKYLSNGHLKLGKGADSIVVIGLTYADKHTRHPERLMSEAMPEWQSDSHFKIMLQHSPALWDTCFSRLKGVDLTLSGHTHAMQMVGRLWGGKRWSPASLIYPEWGGLYKSKTTGGLLYVNIGTGMVGPPMRLGSARPEITVITLRHSNR